MKTFLTFLIIFGITYSSFGMSGIGIFKRHGCGVCHKETINTIGPSVKKISEFYKGNKKALKEYLLGKRPPIVEPDKAQLMNKFIKKTKNYSDKELDAIVNYLTSFSSFVDKLK
jgi:cytochrome c